MGVVSYIYHHDSCPRQADNITVFVLRAGGKYFLTLWVCVFFFSQLHFPPALCTVYPHFPIMHSELCRRNMSIFFTHFGK